MFLCQLSGLHVGDMLMKFFRKKVFKSLKVVEKVCLPRLTTYHQLGWLGTPLGDLKTLLKCANFCKKLTKKICSKEIFPFKVIHADGMSYLELEIRKQEHYTQHSNSIYSNFNIYQKGMFRKFNYSWGCKKTHF